MTNTDNFWVEKYRPSSLNDLVLTEENIRIINKFVKDSEIPNLLLYGNPGTGKTSLAKILVNTLDAEHLLLNCSEVGIDVVRTTITQFSQTKSFNGKMKIVICDEMDSASSDAQRGLRNTMEENAGYCRYILTSNYINRIIQPLQSRCQSLHLAPPIEGIVKRIGYILKNENVEIDDNNKIKLVKLVKRLYPDTRKCINEIQKYSIDKKLSLPDINTADDFAAELINFILKNDPLLARKYVIENENEFNADYPILLKSLFDCICNTSLPITPLQKKMWLITVGEYIYRGNFVVDPEINFYCLILALTDIKP
jgi:DNA polymerase III delta prime subunit